MAKKRHQNDAAKRIHEAHRSEIENVNPPQSLHPDKLDAILSRGDALLHPKKEKVSFKFYQAASIAASLLLVVGIGFAGIKMQAGKQHLPVGESSETSSAYGYTLVSETAAENPTELSFKNFIGEDESDYTPLLSYVKEQMKNAQKERDSGGFWFTWKNGFVVEEATEADGGMKTDSDGAMTPSMNAGANADSDTEGREFSSTNNQVETVQEGDIIKTDGKYMAVLTIDGMLSVNKIEADGSLTLLAAESLLSTEHHYQSVLEMYLYEDTIALVFDGKMDSKASTEVKLYQITEGGLKKNGSYSQEGYYRTGRLTDGALYIITNQYKFGYYDTIEDVEDTIPAICKDGVKELVTPENIYVSCCPIYSAEYTNITGYKIGDAVENLKTVSILGSDSSTVYCTADTLYLFENNYHWEEEKSSITTEINAFSIGGGNITPKASGSVIGTMLNQFSADAYKGKLRIATHDNDANRMTVLDENLKVVSELTGIAKGEQIYSCRFMGDTAYMVTFYNTDPLFVIDLSDEAAPKVAGEVELPGFSEYLHPFGENYLIGIGRNTDDNGWIDGVRINLFDISDPTNPKVADAKTLNGDSMTLISETHKAFYLDEKNNRFGVPLYRYIDSNAGFNGFVMFAVENGKLQVVNEFDFFKEHAALDWDVDYHAPYAYNAFFVQRGVYVGDSLYLMGRKGIYQYNRNDSAYLAHFDLH